MHFTTSFAAGGLGANAPLVILWGLFVTIFWMVCGWRAMRAHERLADAAEDIGRRSTG